MPVATFDKPIENIRVDQLDIKKGEFKGEWIKGGPIQEFSSTGIIDKASDVALTVVDGCIIVDTIKTKTLSGDVVFTGKTDFASDVLIKGKLEVDELITKKLIADETTDRQFIEFSHRNKRESSVGTGFIWTDKKKYTKQFVYLAKPDRLYSTEPIQVHKDKSFMIGPQDVLTENTLGSSVVKSSLQQLGVLRSLKVSGAMQVGEHIFYDPNLDRVGLGTDKPAGDFAVFNFENDTNFVIDSEENLLKLGSYNNKTLGVITDNQVRIKIGVNGNVTIGTEGNSDSKHIVWGKLGIGIKDPEHSIDVSGNIKFQNRIFTVAQSAPTSGIWNKGDTVWNENPKPDAPVGWICTGGGKPGKWAPFGYIGNNLNL